MQPLGAVVEQQLPPVVCNPASERPRKTLFVTRQEPRFHADERSAELLVTPAHDVGRLLDRA